MYWTTINALILSIFKLFSGSKSNSSFAQSSFFRQHGPVSSQLILRFQFSLISIFWYRSVIAVGLIQVEFLIIDININTPKISAMGVFDIGPNLLPSVKTDRFNYILCIQLFSKIFILFLGQFFGIALTHLVILLQVETLTEQQLTIPKIVSYFSKSTVLCVTFYFWCEFIVKLKRSQDSSHLQCVIIILLPNY